MEKFACLAALILETAVPISIKVISLDSWDLEDVWRLLTQLL